MEYISSIELAAVSLEASEELDILLNGPIVWTAGREIPIQISIAGETNVPFVTHLEQIDPDTVAPESAARGIVS